MKVSLLYSIIIIIIINICSPALSNGVALFYEVLKFITSETKQFPPSCQFLTSCIEILGQVSIENDSLSLSHFLLPSLPPLGVHIT